LHKFFFLLYPNQTAPKHFIAELHLWKNIMEIAIEEILLHQVKASVINDSSI